MSDKPHYTDKEKISRLAAWHEADKATIAALQAETARWKRAIEGLTPGGSEFVNDPETCAKFIKDRTKYPRQIIDLRQENTALQARITKLETALMETVQLCSDLDLQVVDCVHCGGHNAHANDCKIIETANKDLALLGKTLRGVE